MGQYYRPCILKKNWKLATQPIAATVCPYDYDNGAKLTEHSYIGNNFVSVVAQLLGGKYFGHPFVWCGDYADSVKVRGKDCDLYTKANEYTYKYYHNATSYDTSKKYDKIRGMVEDEWKDFKYLINLTKKVYVKLPKYDKKQGKWRVHPLPLLTALGNGRGGGDYRLKNKKVGSWAFDRIGMSNDDKDIEGMKKVSGYFKLDD